MDVPLSELVEKNQKKRKQQTGKAPVNKPRRQNNNQRGQPYPRRHSSSGSDSQWKHDLYQKNNNNTRDQKDSVKLVIDNLPYSVDERELRNLFSQFGPLLKANINFNSRGQSNGSAEVKFKYRNDGIAAKKRVEWTKLERETNRDFDSWYFK